MPSHNNDGFLFVLLVWLVFFVLCLPGAVVAVAPVCLCCVAHGGGASTVDKYLLAVVVRPLW